MGAQDDHGNTPLHYCAENATATFLELRSSEGSQPSVVETSNSNMECARQLIEAGASPHVPNKEVTGLSFILCLNRIQHGSKDEEGLAYQGRRLLGPWITKCVGHWQRETGEG